MGINNDVFEKYRKAWEAYKKTWRAHKKAGEAHDKAWEACRKFAQPDGMPESSLKIGDFVQVIAPDSHRKGECGEIIGMHFAVGWVVKFARYDPRDNPSPSTVKLFHGLALREDQLRKEP